MRILILGIVLIYLLSSCNNNSQKPEIKQKEIITDTIVLYEHVQLFDTIQIPIKQESQLKDSILSTQDSINAVDFIYSRFPTSLLESELLKGISFNEKYTINYLMNPLYLEADLNNDGNVDVVIPITEKETGKAGFAIIHGLTNEVFYIGAGIIIKKSWSDDWYYTDVWRINRKLKNNPGVGEKKALILEHESLELKNSGIGGGIVFWNGEEYEYFHQTC